MTEQSESTGDELAELIAGVQESADNGESAARVRMRLVQRGMDANAADAIIHRVYSNTDAPLSERHRQAASAAVDNRWMFWIGGLVLINLLSWLFDWPFWIY